MRLSWHGAPYAAYAHFCRFAPFGEFARDINNRIDAETLADYVAPDSWPVTVVFYTNVIVYRNNGAPYRLADGSARCGPRVVHRELLL
jgi:hypothetical protein